MTEASGFWSREVRALANSVKKSRERALRSEGRFMRRLKTREVGEF